MNNQFLLGLQLARLDFWVNKKKYNVSIQFWGDGDNNVYIVKEDVEVAVFGGCDTAYEAIDKTVTWFEKSNPSIKYPNELGGANIDLPD